MKIACIDPIVNSNNCVSICIFENENLIEHVVIDAGNVGQIKADKYICYDIFKIFAGLGIDLFVEDVKTLYNLFGLRKENIILLAKGILDDSTIFEYSSLTERINAHLRSYKIAKIKVFNYSIFEIMPRDLVMNSYRKRSEIIMNLYNNVSKNEELMKFYKNFYKVLKNLFKISQDPIFVDLDSIKHESGHIADAIRRNCMDDQIFLKYNPVGAKTGRLTFRKGSVNVYTLPKNLRRVLVAPKYYKILQADFRSFQPRLAIFCTDDEQFKERFMDVEDIYSVFPGDRETNKLSFIAWMFSKRKNAVFNSEAVPILELREKLYKTANQEGKLINKFGRPLYYRGEEKNVLLQNYITSSEADAILSLMVLLNYAFRRRKSRIAFPFYDSLVFYIHDDERRLVGPIKEYMEVHLKNIFGSIFPVSLKEGDNLEDMKEIQ